MTFDPEELQKRRQERAQRRARQKARKRKLIICLVIAGVILAGCAILIYRVTQNAEPAVSSPAVSTPADSSEPEAATETVIHLAAAGDLNVTDRVVTAGGIDYDYTDVFMDVTPLLADADITLLNFEGNLCGTPYGTDSGSAPHGLMESLRSAGVDLIQLANSYSINRGLSGLSSTIDGVYAAGLEPVGAYTDEAAFKAGKGYTIRTVQGIKIAFVAFTKGMDGMALPEGSKNCVNVLYTDYESTYQDVDEDKINDILDAAASEKPDLTVVLLHWGSEYNDTFSTSQKKIVELLQQRQVDAIIGTHPHYLQQMEYDPQAGSFIAYSLGDFFSDGTKPGTEYSVILDLEITKNHETGDTRITGYSMTPIFTVSDEAELRVVRLNEAIAAYEADYLGKVSKATYEDMLYAATRIQERTAAPEETAEEDS